MSTFDFIVFIIVVVCLKILIHVLRIHRRLNALELHIDVIKRYSENIQYGLKQELDDIRRILSEKNPDSKK